MNVVTSPVVRDAIPRGGNAPARRVYLNPPAP
jgi:hypothetical protein